jgi:uncharacterized protein YneF (UPF0154 family)
MKRVLVLAAFASVVLATAPSRADVFVTMTESRGNGQPDREVFLYLEPDRVRLAVPGGGVIYRDDQKLLWAIDDNERSYFEVTPAMRQGMTDMMRAMQDQLRNMPEAQRKQLEQMLGQQGVQLPSGQQGNAPVTYTKTAPGKTVGSWRCDEYEQRVGGKKTAELCLAGLADLGLRPDDVRALNALYAESQFAMQVTGRAEAFDMKRMAEAAGRDVLPIRAVIYDDNGQKRSETAVKSLRRAVIAPEYFEVPQGYTKRDMPMMGPLGR